jgi:23S rRNA pseudoU1915 N3-methylase RlmH
MNIRKELGRSKYEVSKENHKYVEETIQAFVRGWQKAVEREMDEINTYRRSNRRFKRITPSIYKTLSERIFKTTSTLLIIGEVGQYNSETSSSKAKEKST